MFLLIGFIISGVDKLDKICIFIIYLKLENYCVYILFDV